MLVDGSDRMTLPDLLHRRYLQSQVLGRRECGRGEGSRLVGHWNGLRWITDLGGRCSMFLLGDLVELVIKCELQLQFRRVLALLQPQDRLKSGFSSFIVPSSGRFQLSDLACLGYKLWLMFCIIVCLTQTLILTTTLTLFLP